MIDIIKKNGRWKDYFNIKEPEVCFSIVFTIIIMAVSVLVNIYGDFRLYQEDVKSLFYCIIGAFIGIAGFSLSGIAILTSMFTEKQIETIEKNNGRGVIERIMSSFAFLAFNVVAFVGVMIIILICVTGELQIPNAVVFYAVEAICIYAIFFNMFYTVSLVFNCIQCFSIKRIYDKNSEKDFFEKANEVRIDYMLSFILKENGISREQFLKSLNQYSAHSEYEKELIEYFKNYYREN